MNQNLGLSNECELGRYSISVSCVAITVGCNDELVQKSNSFEILLIALCQSASSFPCAV